MMLSVSSVCTESRYLTMLGCSSASSSLISCMMPSNDDAGMPDSAMRFTATVMPVVTLRPRYTSP